MTYGVESRSRYNEPDRHNLDHVMNMLTMRPDDPLIHHLQEWSAKDLLPVFFASFENRYYKEGISPWHTIRVITAPGKDKLECGDWIALQTGLSRKEDDLYICVGDGQTPISPVHPNIAPLVGSRLIQGQGTDCFVPNICRRATSDVMRGSSEFEAGFTNFLDLYNSRDYTTIMAMYLDDCDCQQMYVPRGSTIAKWISYNYNLSQLYYRFSSGIKDVPPAQLPGMTGIIAHLENRNYVLRFQQTSIGDSPVYGIIGRTANKLSIDQNSPFDFDTVSEMRMGRNRAELLREGHFERSYNNKANRRGGVYVCNGSRNFTRCMVNAPSPEYTGNAFDCILMLTDGSTYDAKKLDTFDQARLKRRLQQLMTADPQQIIREIYTGQRETFNANDPLRERESDDFSAVVVYTVPPEQVARNIKQLVLN